MNIKLSTKVSVLQIKENVIYLVVKYIPSPGIDPGPDISVRREMKKKGCQKNRVQIIEQLD